MKFSEDAVILMYERLLDIEMAMRDLDRLRLEVMPADYTLIDDTQFKTIQAVVESWFENLNRRVAEILEQS